MIESPSTSDCETHLDGPPGYIEWARWAEYMTKTHVQSLCLGCGLWKIWTPRS